MEQANQEQRVRRAAVPLHKCAGCDKRIPTHRERCMDCVGGCNWIIRTRAGANEPPAAGRRCGAKCYNGLCWKHSEHGRAAASEKAGRMRIRRRERERAQAAAEQAE